MKKSYRWIGAALAVFAVAAPPARASFLQELGSPFAVGTVPYGLLPADFNGDGAPDLLSINGGSSSATLLLRRAAGGFAAEGTTPVAGAPNFGVVADFNRDQRPDFAAAGFADPGAAGVYLRQSAGGFLEAPASPFTTGPLGSIAAGDFDRDGLLDLVVGQFNAGTVTVLRQRANGTFSQEGAPIPTGVQPRYIVTSDFNADGRTDVAVSNAGPGTVSILLGQADGSLQNEPGSPFRVGVQPWMIAVADFTRDGRPDLAVANYTSNQVSLLARGADGGFTPMAGSPIAVPGGPVGIATADFNRDGQADLAVSSVDANAVTVLLRQGDGSFAPEPGSPLPTGAAPYGLATADFNLDGKPDIATANRDAGSVTVLLNTTPDPAAPPAPPPPPAPAPTPSINARLVLAWTVSKTSVKLNSARLRDLPIGARVRVYCKPCKVSQTLTAKKSTLSLTKLVNKRLKRRATFTVAISRPGWNGLTFTRKVRNYGRTKKALRKAVKAPFTETRRCVPATPGGKC
ncbi:VCBS repeat protein [Solirubrobacter pauli]|uniref:VCBS repeat protein n=1 Tax=Solirubrobacter pauli TaxID=166793 RepID=A0A660KZU0_9ACTN|nr:VCBS repeat-containing protein [Solirubrobacter pauli]RKQ87207.1 VCBS repeat protein [Solirubrobacter pauli]